MKILIAYYSRADENYFGGSLKYINKGNTQKVAEMIQKITGGDLYKIEEKVPYPADYKACTIKAKEDLINQVRPTLTNPLPELKEYDEIYLGYPNYWGTMPMAVYTFLESLDFNNKVIHPFCTHEGSGLGGTLSDIEKCVPNAILKNGLAIEGSYVDSSFEKVKNWIK